MKYLALFLLITLLIIKSTYSQYTIKDIPYDLNKINKQDKKGKQGLWITYDQYEAIHSLQHFVNDTLDGYFENYWLTTGKISSKGYYKNGKFDSLFIGYWEDSKIRGEAFYKEGLLHGIATTYNQDGELTSRKRYQNGKVDSLFQEAYMDSTIIFDKQPITVDTLITNYEFSKWNKIMAIYVNDTLTKEIIFYKDQPAIENFFEQALLTRRIVYSNKKPYYIERIFYFKDEKLIKSEYFDKKGRLKK